MDNAECWLRLLRVAGLSSKRLRQYSSRLIQPISNIDSLLYQLGLDGLQIEQFGCEDDAYLAAGLAWLQQTGNYLISYADPRYPPLLRHISQAPPVLFVRGDPAVLQTQQLAMVGSRTYSHYGEHWGYHFAYALAASQLTITSGLALGIDAICHKAALDAKGKTLAVLGSGLAAISPVRHIALAEQIVASGGVLVSEFLPTQPPLPTHFPRRNRIISGLSRAVFIVEASMKSGSLITARHALDQGRDVFALPGPLGNTGYNGTHWLIQQGAYLVTHPNDVIEHFDHLFSVHSVSEPVNIIPLFPEPEHANVLSHIGDEPTPIDLIAERSGMSVIELTEPLIELELMGSIKLVQGGYIHLRRLSVKGS